jgi:hypothetical protein
VLDPYDRETRVAWTDVLLLACAELPDDAPDAAASEPDEKRAPRSAEALALAVLGDARADARTRAVLDLVVRDPARRYRIEATAFDYTCLGARKEPSAARNFRRLVQRLAERALAARHNQGATALLAHDALHRYASEALLDRETAYFLWKLHDGDLARCKRAPVARAGAAALDPALLLGSLHARTGFWRGRRSPLVMRVLLPLVALAVLGWLMWLLNRMTSASFDAMP